MPARYTAASMLSRGLVLVLTLFLLAAGLMARPQASEMLPSAQAVVAVADASTQDRDSAERELDDRIQPAGETVADVQDLLTGALPVPDPGFSMARPPLATEPARPAPWLDGLRRPPKAPAFA
jgi:hypothetical protein